MDGSLFVNLPSTHIAVSCHQPTSLFPAINPHRCFLPSTTLIAAMSLLVVASVILVLLSCDPLIVFQIICNLCHVVFLLLGEWCRRGYHLCRTVATSHTVHKMPTYVFRCVQALSHAVWTVLDFASRVGMRTAGRDGQVNNTSTPTVAPEGDDPVHNTPAFNAGNNDPASTPGRASSSSRRCAGVTIDGRPCKREKGMSTGNAGVWYCWDHDRPTRRVTKG